MGGAAGNAACPIWVRGERAVSRWRLAGAAPSCFPAVPSLLGTLFYDRNSILIPQPGSVVDVKMQVLGGLVVTAVRGESASTVFHGHLAAEFGCYTQHFIHHRYVAGFHGGEGANVPLGDDHDVDGPVGMRVVEGEHVVRLQELLHRDFAAQDLVAIEIHHLHPDRFSHDLNQGPLLSFLQTFLVSRFHWKAHHLTPLLSLLPS